MTNLNQCCLKANAAPVSYTHLDVYKRQQLPFEPAVPASIAEPAAEPATDAEDSNIEAELMSDAASDTSSDTPSDTPSNNLDSTPTRDDATSASSEHTHEQ